MDGTLYRFVEISGSGERQFLNGHLAGASRAISMRRKTHGHVQVNDGTPEERIKSQFRGLSGRDGFFGEDSAPAPE